MLFADLLSLHLLFFILVIMMHDAESHICSRISRLEVFCQESDEPNYSGEFLA